MPAPPKISTPADVDLDDTQEIDPPVQHRTGGEDDFAECAACSANPGMPTLCPSCLHNRDLVSRLRRQIKAHSTPESEPFDGDQRIPAELDYRASGGDVIEEVARYVEGHATGYSESFDNAMRNTARSIRRHFASGLQDLAAPAGLTPEQELWAMGWCAGAAARDLAECWRNSDIAENLLDDFRERFPGALP